MIVETIYLVLSSVVFHKSKVVLDIKEIKEIINMEMIEEGNTMKKRLNTMTRYTICDRFKY